MRSERADLRGLRTLRSLRDLELDALVLLERAVTVSDDRREVHEDIGATAVLGNETKALFGVEPLDAALSHLFFSLRKCSSPLFADQLVAAATASRRAGLARTTKDARDYIP